MRLPRAHHAKIRISVSLTDEQDTFLRKKAAKFIRANPDVSPGDISLSAIFQGLLDFWMKADETAEL